MLQLLLVDSLPSSAPSLGSSAPELPKPEDKESSLLVLLFLKADPEILFSKPFDHNTELHGASNLKEEVLPPPLVNISVQDLSSSLSEVVPSVCVLQSVLSLNKLYFGLL